MELYENEEKMENQIQRRFQGSLRVTMSLQRYRRRMEQNYRGLGGIQLQTNLRRYRKQQQ